MSGWHFASHLSHGGYTLLSMSYGRVSRANVWRFALLSLLIFALLFAQEQARDLFTFSRRYPSQLYWEHLGRPGLGREFNRALIALLRPFCFLWV